MPRKDRYRKDLRTIAPEEQAYWEEILRRENLSMSAGANGKISPKLVYCGSTNDLDGIYEATVQKEWGGRKVTPEGHGPDSD